MNVLETPSRVLRRIEAFDEEEIPSLPSLPVFDDSNATQTESESDNPSFVEDNILPVHSTPAPTSSYTATTIRPPSSNSSTARFAGSIASRSISVKSSLSSASRIIGNRDHHDDFNISPIHSLPDSNSGGERTDDERSNRSKNSDLEVNLPSLEENASLTEALQSISRSSSPIYPQMHEHEPTSKKKYDYSISLRSEPQPSPIDKYRNVALRRPLARARTPSLSHTTPSPESSPTNSTPGHDRSIPLPRSPSSSPIIGASVPLPPSATSSPAMIHADDVAMEHPEQEDLRLSQEAENISELLDDQPVDRSSQEHGHSTDTDRKDLTGIIQQNDTSSAQTDEREPTFSSESSGESDPRQSAAAVVTTRSPISSAAFSSPATSVAFTPTPAVPPRPRPRFNVAPPPRHLLQEDDQEVDQDPVTPHTRRRSFLLSVINSTARPRMKFPTPHPHVRMSDIGLDMPRGGESSVDGQSTPVQLRTAFAGVTPRPGRGRLSHPLAQTYIPSTDVSESESALESGVGESDGQGQLGSPYDTAGDRASFISTASSHDLTTHMRANTSFDPVMGLGERGVGVGRFNAVKLNAYLHGLNRRLQEENEALVQRLKKTEDEKLLTDGRRHSMGGVSSAGMGIQSRRVSTGGTILGEVKEDTSAEGWAEEKRELEEAVETLERETDRIVQEKAALEKALEDERAERTRDKDRWRERMAEVQKGVEGIVRELESKLEDAEKKRKDVEQEKDALLIEKERRLEAMQSERDDALERVDRAEAALESEEDLGGELRYANDRISALMGDLRNANMQLKGLEDEVLRADQKVDELEDALRAEKESARAAEEDMRIHLTEATDQIQALQEQMATANAQVEVLEKELEERQDYIRNLEEDIQHAYEEGLSLKGHIAELGEGATKSAEQIATLEGQLSGLQQQIRLADDQANERIGRLTIEAERAAELARQMEDALEAAETKMRTDEDSIANLKGQLASLEREKAREQEISRWQQQSKTDAFIADPDVIAMEAELDEAHKEIARLNTLLEQSPARKAITNAKDAKLEMLEREKEELLERIKLLRTTMTDMATPSKFTNGIGISPMHRKMLSMSMRIPKTPGAPLADLSWLNSTKADLSVSPLLAELSRLQHDLDRANNSIDDKLDKLEDAGLGVVGLTKELEDARLRIAHLEDDISKLRRREDRRMRRLERLRCRKCLLKLDLPDIHWLNETTRSEPSRSLLASEPPTPPTKTSEVLRKDLQATAAELAAMKSQWQEEKNKLLGEKAILQDATNRLNDEVRQAQQGVKRADEIQKKELSLKAGIQNELHVARATIAELESELQGERSGLRQKNMEQANAQREKNELMLQLRRTETDIEDVKRQLNAVKQENHQLENELRVNANLDQKARLLEARVSENAETIDSLRHERSMLAENYKQLQQKFAEVSERTNKLRSECAISQTSHDNRRHQLDLRLLEIEELQRALSDQADELQRTEQEKNRIAAEKKDVAKIVTALEADLNRVRRDSEALGRDLRNLRAERDQLQERQKEEASKAARTQKQAQTQIRLLAEQLDDERYKLRSHVCAASNEQLTAMKIQHNKECKGLIVQIRYLKAKFSRESAFRDDLGYQKHYLLILLSTYEKSEQRILASIAKIGYPKLIPPPQRKSKSLKSAALTIIFIRRAKLASISWQEHSASKEAIAAALQEVRQKRAAVS